MALAKEPSTRTEVPKAQPWKVHWSPNKNASLKADRQYILNSAGEAIVDGGSGGDGLQYIASSFGNVIVDGITIPGDGDGSLLLYSELACSYKTE